MKKTFTQLKEIDQLYTKLLKGNEKFTDTKLGYAFKRFTEKNLKKAYEELNDELNVARIDKALTNKDTGAIIYRDEKSTSSREFEYSPSNLKELLKDETRIIKSWEEKEIEVEPYICKDLGKTALTQEDKELITGVLI